MATCSGRAASLTSRSVRSRRGSRSLRIYVLEGVVVVTFLAIMIVVVLPAIASYLSDEAIDAFIPSPSATAP